MTQCAKIIVVLMANFGKVFIKRSQTFFYVCEFTFVRLANQREEA